MTAILPKVKIWIDQPFNKKLDQSRHSVLKWYGTSNGQPDDNDYYSPQEHTAISFSGGKDSTVVLSLVRDYVAQFALEDNDLRQAKKHMAKVNVVYGNTGVEYPETTKFVHMLRDLWGFNLIELKPDRTFWDCVDETGLPGGKDKRPSRNGGKTDICCYYLKEKPMLKCIKDRELKVVYLGVTALESRQRMIKASTHGDCYIAQKWGVRKVLPILYWSEKEVWSYIHKNNIPFNPVYRRKYVKRCGCMPCTAHKNWKEEICNEKPSLCAKILSIMGQSQLLETPVI